MFLFLFVSVLWGSCAGVDVRVGGLLLGSGYFFLCCQMPHTLSALVRLMPLAGLAGIAFFACHPLLELAVAFLFNGSFPDPPFHIFFLINLLLPLLSVLAILDGQI